jgi:hypothetical protein
MTSIKVKIQTEDVLRGKFSKTIAAIEGVLREAKGDKEVNQSYTANGVYGRAERIKEAFETDLESLSKEIELTNP